MHYEINHLKQELRKREYEVDELKKQTERLKLSIADIQKERSKTLLVSPFYFSTYSAMIFDNFSMFNPFRNFLPLLTALSLIVSHFFFLTPPTLLLFDLNRSSRVLFACRRRHSGRVGSVVRVGGGGAST